MMSKDFELQLTQVATESKVKSLRKARDDYADKLKSLPDMQRQFAILTRKVEALEIEKKTLDDNVAKNDRLLDITSPDFLTVTQAKVPTLPKTSNHKTMTIMCSVLVLGAGLLGIFGTILLDPRLKSKGDLAASVKTPVLGELAALPRRQAEFPPLANSELAVSMSALTRSIRRLIPRIGARIAIASVRTGEGASSLAAGIAMSLARQGERVLLISLSTGTNASMLSHEGLDKVDWVSQATKEGVDLATIAVGGQPGRPFVLPPLPDEVSSDDLTSISMRTALQSAEKAFDVTVFDLEAVREGLQVELMGGFCDGVILVTKSAVMKKDIIKRVERDLDAAKVPLVGWILNFVPRMYQEPL
jgi:Mrp family chromosome partitioning ATPase